MRNCLESMSAEVVGPGLDPTNGDCFPWGPEVEHCGGGFSGEEAGGAEDELAHEATAVPVPCGHEGDEQHVAVEHVDEPDNRGSGLLGPEPSGKAGEARVSERNAGQDHEAAMRGGVFSERDAARQQSEKAKDVVEGDGEKGGVEHRAAA